MQHVARIAVREPDLLEADVAVDSIEGHVALRLIPLGCQGEQFVHPVDVCLGQLVENIPRNMHVAVPVLVEVRIIGTRVVVVLLLVGIDLELVEVADLMSEVEFKVFAGPANDPEGRVAALCLPGGSELSRKEIDDLTEFVAIYKAKGLAWIKVRENEWQSPITKFFSDEEKEQMKDRLDMEPGDLVFFVADQPKVTNEALGHLRNHIGEKLGLIDKKAFNFVWVTHFPLMEYDEVENRNQALHHPFTAPLEEDYDKLDSDPLSVISRRAKTCSYTAIRWKTKHSKRFIRTESSNTGISN